MATPVGESYLVGPAPFKDVAGGGGDDHRRVVSPPEEYADMVSAMPRATMIGFPMRLHEGTWVIDEAVTGVLSIQRRFAARPGDVLLASPPKCGTTWLKGLAFATMARAAYPPRSGDHPLLRLNPHECVPFLDGLFSAGQEAKVEALPSPRLMNTHMHHSLLPPSVTDNPDCKVVYVCSSDKNCPALMNFLRSDIRFASVDIPNDKIKMRKSFNIEIPAACHIDIQDLFRLKHKRTSMADMAVALIDDHYADMKTKLHNHQEWETTPLHGSNIEYAAIDAFVAYELYRMIRIMNYGQRHLVQQAPPPPPAVWGQAADDSDD